MKRYLFILAILLSVMSVTAQWEHQAHDVNRTQYYPEYATFLPTGGSSIELTCGTDTSAQYQSPGLFGTFEDSNTVPDLFLMCMGDSDNAVPHLIMVRDDLVQLDTDTLTTELAGFAAWLPYSMCEYDGNASTQEFCIWNPYDLAGQYQLSILIYSFDSASSHEFAKLDEWVFNASGNIMTTDTGTFNLTGISMNGAQTRNIIECYDNDTCYIVSDDIVFKTDMTAHNTVNWINHTGADAVMIDTYRAALPIFTDEFIYVLNDTTQHIYRINKSDGNYDAMLFDSGSDDYETMALYDCSSSDCGSDAELLLSNTALDKAYLFDISDGTQLEGSDTLTGDTPYAWIEDWDNDGTEELCFANFGSAGTSTAKCEELNLFAFDTLDDDWDFNTTTDASCVESMVRVDMNADNKSDFIIGTNMVLSSGNAYLPYVIQSLYDITDGTSGDIAHAYSLFDSANTSTGTLLSWYFGLGNNDTVFLTSSYPYEEEAIVNLPEFYNEPVQSIANPICNYSTVAFECTYANGCAIDDEYDRFGLCYDCFGDGTQANCYSAGEFFIHYDTWYCDVSGKAGQQNMTVQIFEDGYEDTNDSIVYEYIVGTVGCYNETDPGEVEVPYVNTPPTFTWYPTPLYPSPFCRDGTVRFECLNWSCYYDYEGNDVWFAVDCDEDGDIDTVTDVGQGANFTCTFNYSENQSGSHTVTAYVYDLANEGTFEDSVGFSVVISNYTRQNVTDAGELLCSSSSFIRSDGTVIIPTAPVIEEPEGNFVYELYKDFSDVFDTTPAIVGWLVTLLGSGLVAWVGFKSGEGNPVTGAILAFAGLSVFHSVMGIYGWTGVIVIVCVAVGFGIYRSTKSGE